MDMGGIPLLKAIVNRMQWLNKNQEVLSHNIANADTPDYQVRALKKQEFRNLLDQTGATSSDVRGPERVRLASSAPGHIPSGGRYSGGFDQEDGLIEEESPDGNSVVIEDELMKVGRNQMEYSLMTNLYRKHTSMLRAALGRGGGR